MTPHEVSVSQLIDELSVALGARPRSGIAFDADGTLWQGDVGEEAFVSALRQNLIRGEAHEALRAEVLKHGLSDAGTANELGARLLEAFHEGQYPERAVCEVMVWGYAGWTQTAVSEFMESLHGERRNDTVDAVLEVAEWARRAGATRAIVSASPSFALMPAARALGFAKHEIVGGEPSWSRDDTMLPRMARALPYAADKARLGRQRLKGAHWLASFGDSVFDAEMLRAAEFAVMVEPKPALRGALQGHPKSARLLI